MRMLDDDLLIINVLRDAGFHYSHFKKTKCQVHAKLLGAIALLKTCCTVCETVCRESINPMGSQMFPYFEDLKKKDLIKITEGGERIVYAHNQYPNFVFKQQKPIEYRQLKPLALKSFLLKNLDGFDTFIVRQEYRSFVKFMLNYTGKADCIPVARLFGFVSSEIGVLQVSEKVGNQYGECGPTLSFLLREGCVNAKWLKALNAFANQLILSGIPTNDVNANNIVMGTGSSDDNFFKLVDGFGDIHALPIRTYSQRVRRQHLVKLFSNMKKHGLHFDPDTITFSLK